MTFSCRRSGSSDSITLYLESTNSTEICRDCEVEHLGEEPAEEGEKAREPCQTYHGPPYISAEVLFCTYYPLCVPTCTCMYDRRIWQKSHACIRRLLLQFFWICMPCDVHSLGLKCHMHLEQTQENCTKQFMSKLRTTTP